VNKTELILYNRLVEYYPTLKRQYKVEWCKNIKYLPFDFVIEEIKVIIELDGKQHFEQIGNWLSPEETRKTDLFKMKCANQNGFSIIRILQKDVYNNKYIWLKELCENIKKITNENRVQNIYMCKNNEYKDFDIS
jgi:very-short-patch-repair endonuclease